MQWTDRVASLAEQDHLTATEKRKGRSREISGTIFTPTSPASQSAPKEKSMELRKIPIALRLEGPYFTTADPTRYHTVVCLVAGTGVTGALAVTAAFKEVERQSALPTSTLPMQSESITSSPCSPNIDPGSHFVPCDPCSANSNAVCSRGQDSSRNSVSCMPPVQRGKRIWERCVVVWSVREEDFVDLPGFEMRTLPRTEFAVPSASTAAPISDSKSGFELRKHLTGNGKRRMDAGAVLDEILGSDSANEETAFGSEERSLWVYISGPNAFIAAGEEACKARQGRGVEWYGARWDI